MWRMGLGKLPWLSAQERDIRCCVQGQLLAGCGGAEVASQGSLQGAEGSVRK